jgi:hypothetical protein
LHETIRKGGIVEVKYTAGQAAKAVGVATATITRSLKSGKISGQKDESGAWVIDPAELHRVFPPVSLQGSVRHSMKGHTTPSERDERHSDFSAIEREVKVLRDSLADAREDRDKWRDMAERLSLAPPVQSQRKGWWPWTK